MNLKVALVISLVLNVILGGYLALLALNSPTYELGELQDDVRVGLLGGSDAAFELPRGLTVQDLSPRGISAIGQFEPNRFGIVVTTERGDIVDYSVPRDSLHPFGNLYSMDLRGD